MKKDRLTPRRLATIGSMLIAGLAALAPLPAQAQDAAREKIRLMADALRARGEGDLQEAKTNLEELLRMEPSNPDVQRLLESVNRDIERGVTDQSPTYSRPATSPEPEPRDMRNARSRSSVQDGTQTFAPIEPGSTTVQPAPQSNEVESMLIEAEREQGALIAAAMEQIATAERAVNDGNLTAAETIVDQLTASIDRTVATENLYNRIDEVERQIRKRRIQSAIDAGNIDEARIMLDEYRTMFDDDIDIEAELEAAATDPTKQRIEEVSPSYVANMEAVEERLLVARTRFIHGDYEGARQVLGEIEILDPNNTAAKHLLSAIASINRERATINRSRTREEMLEEVAGGWTRPKVFTPPELTEPQQRETGQTGDILQKLNELEVPRFTFSGELSRAIENLSELSAEIDPTGEGINIVLLSTDRNPQVRVSLRGISIRRVLDFITRQANFNYDIEPDAVIVQPSVGEGDRSRLVTEFFPISRGIVIRLIGADTGGGGGGGGGGGDFDPFAPAGDGGGGGGGGGGELTEQAGEIISFFESAGVPFESVEGARLAYEGAEIIVTNTIENIQKIERILQRYDQTKLVEIEAKFLEVQQEDLEELGFDWTASSDGMPTFSSDGTPILGPTGQPVLQYDRQFDSGLRSLQSAFGINRETSQINITNLGQTDTVDASAPSIPGTIGLGGRGGNVFSTVGVVQGADVNLAINALSRKEGSDLMSAPRLTVLSGRTANIVIAQELLYPTEYGDIEANVSQSGGRDNGGGSSSVAITAGTPQDFERRNIGVEMEVKPTVEQNNNINLFLKPIVTEFEGFVEYGGPSVAVAGGTGNTTSVTVPPGFYQPIFSTRTVTTEVTIFDGATVVIGGLMREEIRRVEDKVPVLGDIPFLGRAFQSKGEVAQKRNLMIFVTANILSPGGSPSRQNLERVEANSLFQNPIIITPGGGVNRTPTE